MPLILILFTSCKGEWIVAAKTKRLLKLFVLPLTDCGETFVYVKLFFKTKFFEKLHQSDQKERLVTSLK